MRKVKVTLTFVGDELGPKTSLKLELPAKWMEGTMAKLRTTFLDNYNKKNAATPLADCYLAKDGYPILDDTLVAHCVVNGDELFVGRGPIPEQGPALVPSDDEEEDSKKPKASKAKDDADDNEDNNVTTQAGIEKAKKFAFDYSKWDKLDLSDDDGADCHPNIELASWKRIKAQQRAERRQREEAEIRRLQLKVDHYAAKAKELEGKEGHAEAVESHAKYTNKLEEFQRTRKWVADDVAQTKEDRSLVNTSKVEFPASEALEPSAETTPVASAASVKAGTTGKPVVGPVPPTAEYDSYDAYVKRHEPLLREFVSIDNDRAKTEQFMLEHGEILNHHADGFLLLLCLDTAMRHKSGPQDKKSAKDLDREKRELARIIRQHLLLNYVLELAKLSKVDDMRAAVKPFFLKTAKSTPQQKLEFENELSAFAERIGKRAEEKLSKGEASPLAPKEPKDEDEYERAGLGPGGLDPNEVLPTLPKEMQQAFVDQDVGRLKEILSSLEPDQANYHLQRCIDSGLWVVPQSATADNDDDDDEEEE